VVPHLGVEIEDRLTWRGVMGAIVDGHTGATPLVEDTLLRRGNESLLSRAAWITGLGSLVKTATVFPANEGIPSINGSVALFSDRTGVLDCTVDFHLLTKWKTAGDSALAASRLARRDTARILIVGSGTVAASMIDAYRSIFSDAEIAVWSRTAENAARLAAAADVEVAGDLSSAVARTDVVCTATMSTDPLVHGTWLHPGQHLDLIGGFRIDMREADDDAIRRASIFVDTASTAGDVGDISGPIGSGVLDAERVTDFTALTSGRFARSSDDEITLFKNAGGAHLDLMVARYMFERHQSDE
jgi:ornithine cyclodeaminase